MSIELKVRFDSSRNAAAARNLSDRFVGEVTGVTLREPMVVSSWGITHTVSAASADAVVTGILGYAGDKATVEKNGTEIVVSPAGME